MIEISPYEAHCLIKAAEAINSSYVSGTGEFRQDEMETCSRLIQRLSLIAGSVTEEG